MRSLGSKLNKIEKLAPKISVGERMQAAADETPQGREARRLEAIAFQKLRDAGRYVDDNPGVNCMRAANETPEGREAARLGALAMIEAQKQYDGD